MVYKGGEYDSCGYCAGTAEHSESHDLCGDGRPDIRSVDDGRGLGQRHYPCVHEAYDHHRGRSGTLDGRRADRADAYSQQTAAANFVKDASLILLDVMLPGISGCQFAKNLRSAGNDIPVIFFTARTTENDLLTGFSAGGDDYISKPFSINEVLARIKAVLGRTVKTDIVTV